LRFGAAIGFFVAMVTVAVQQHQLPKFSVDAYTPASHAVLIVDSNLTMDIGSRSQPKVELFVNGDLVEVSEAKWH
jgi:hypothetical protein